MIREYLLSFNRRKMIQLSSFCNVCLLSISWTFFLAVLIGPHHVFRTSVKDFFGKSVKDILKMSVGDVPWCFTLDHMGTSSGHYLVRYSLGYIGRSFRRYIWTSSGHSQEVILLSGKIELDWNSLTNENNCSHLQQI